MDIKNNILETIGNTPLIKLNKITRQLPATVVAKVDYLFLFLSFLLELFLLAFKEESDIGHQSSIKDMNFNFVILTL